MTHPPIFVTGSGRSGTTWIGDTLAAAAGACSVFEPMAPWALGRPTGSPAQGEEPMGAPGLYLPPHEEHPEWREFWQAVLSGGRTSAWTRQDWRRVPPAANRWRVTRGPAYQLASAHYGLQARRSRRFLVKEIYSNLLLPWLSRRLDLRVVFITRHPCAVVGSRLRLGWPDALDGLHRQPLLMDHWLRPFRDVIEDAATPLERMTTLWCVENLIPLRSWSSDWQHVAYEDLVANPTTGFARLFRELGLTRVEAAERTAAQLCSTPGPDAGKLGAWHSSLSPEDGDRVLHICRRFGLDFYGRQPGIIHSPISSVERTHAPTCLTHH
ncbi:MAG: sulfotransferase [Actinomycetota bacterium]